MAGKKDPLQGIEALLRKADYLTGKVKKEQKQKAACKTCGGTPTIYKGLCQSCIDIERNKKQATEVGKRWFSTNGHEYVYVMTDEGIKPRLYARVRMAEILGRPLQDHEQVGRKNGDKTDNSDENFILTTKAGFDLSTLVCSHCNQSYMAFKALTASSYEENSPTTDPDLPDSAS